MLKDLPSDPANDPDRFLLDGPAPMSLGQAADVSGPSLTSESTKAAKIITSRPKIPEPKQTRASNKFVAAEPGSPVTSNDGKTLPKPPTKRVSSKKRISAKNTGGGATKQSKLASLAMIPDQHDSTEDDYFEDPNFYDDEKDEKKRNEAATQLPAVPLKGTTDKRVTVKRAASKRKKKNRKKRRTVKAFQAPQLTAAHKSNISQQRQIMTQMTQQRASILKLSNTPSSGSGRVSIVTPRGSKLKGGGGVAGLFPTDTPKLANNSSSALLGATIPATMIGGDWIPPPPPPDNNDIPPPPPDASNAINNININMNPNQNQIQTQASLGQMGGMQPIQSQESFGMGGAVQRQQTSYMASEEVDMTGWTDQQKEWHRMWQEYNQQQQQMQMQMQQQQQQQQQQARNSSNMFGGGMFQQIDIPPPPMGAGNDEDEKKAAEPKTVAVTLDASKRASANNIIASGGGGGLPSVPSDMNVSSGDVTPESNEADEAGAGAAASHGLPPVAMGLPQLKPGASSSNKRPKTPPPAPKRNSQKPPPNAPPRSPPPVPPKILKQMQLARSETEAASE